MRFSEKIQRMVFLSILLYSEKIESTHFLKYPLVHIVDFLITIEMICQRPYSLLKTILIAVFVLPGKTFNFGDVQITFCRFEFVK